MGFNTVAVFYNDQTDEWPKDMVRAMQAQSCNEPDNWFGFGRVLSVAHADEIQIVAVNRNNGAALTHFDPIDEKNLTALSDILRAHGYSVKRPGQTTSDEPFSWGYAARQAHKEDTPS